MAWLIHGNLDVCIIIVIYPSLRIGVWLLHRRAPGNTIHQEKKALTISITNQLCGDNDI